jgi:hypothetical protein
VTRRYFVLGAAVLYADHRTELLEVLSKLAAALAAANAVEFMRHIDESAPNRAKLAEFVTALVAQAEITSSIEVPADGRADWYMEVRLRSAGQPVERRRRVLNVRIGENRRLALIEPVEFFEPVQVIDRR